jgi:membrane-associated phospholipid phosphatase
MTGVRLLRYAAAVFFLIPVLSAQSVPASSPIPPQSPVANPDPHSSTGFIRPILQDQGAIFTSPARIHARDWKWLLPLAGSVGFLLASDERNMTERIHTDPLARERSLKVSNAALASLALVPAYLYWSGWRHGDDYTQSTAYLSLRAVLDTAIATEMIRGVTRRQSPWDSNNSSSFFSSGKVSSSFPSLHSGAAWAVAAVVARRHPGWLSQVGVYSLATAVSFSRVTAREHFPSDVLVGSALGFLIGRYVSRPALDRAPRSAWRASEPLRAAAPHTAASGSSYVPMDSWIYAALDRLAAFGLIPSQISGLRPWTRDECRRQALEAERNLPSSARDSEAARLVAAIRRDLDASTAAGSALTLYSLYTRNGFVAGPSLDDSFHFGQTWTNDFGRPYGRGWNSYTGFTAGAASGRFFAYIDGEYQRAPGSDPYSLPVRQAISSMDGIPVQPAAAPSEAGRFRTIEAYAGIRIGDLALSIGKQSLWWGPTYDAPLSFSSNAEPTKNFKISTVHPLHIWPFKEVRGEFVMGKLGGQSYTWRPWFDGVKLSFKLTDNLEMGFTRWSILWGVGHPITLKSFIRNFTSTNSPLGPSGIGATDPGDRKAGFDFRYRVPGLRNWLTVYSDSYADDDPSPLANPRRAAINPGLYLAHVPGIPRLDFRVEAPATTPLDGGWDNSYPLNYDNGQYRGGNTNYGNLVGSWVGRDGRALEAWSTYWLSPRTKFEFGFRHLKGSAKFLPGGSTQNDGTVKVSFRLARDWSADWFMQYEKFYVPLLGPRRTNLSGWMQLTWEPDLQILGRRN